MLTLRDVWQSSTGLLQRFDLLPDPKKAYLKFCEEVTEAQEAFFKWAENRKMTRYRSAAAEELADSLVTLLNWGYANGLTIEEIELAIEKVMHKNAQKTHATHTAQDGWIRKITPVALMEEGQ